MGPDVPIEGDHNDLWQHLVRGHDHGCKWHRRRVSLSQHTVDHGAQLFLPRHLYKYRPDFFSLTYLPISHLHGGWVEWLHDHQRYGRLLEWICPGLCLHGHRKCDEPHRCQVPARSSLTAQRREK